MSLKEWAIATATKQNTKDTVTLSTKQKNTVQNKAGRLGAATSN